MLIFIFVLMRTRLYSQQFFVSLSIIWFAGIFITCLMPTFGPCFLFPEKFSGLPITEMNEMQASLWMMKDYVVQNPKSPFAAYLISAFPSLHVTLIVLGSLYLFNISKVLGLASWAFAIFTIIATLYFGWHYLADDVAAIFIALMAKRLSPVIVAKLGGVESESLYGN